VGPVLTEARWMKRTATDWFTRVLRICAAILLTLAAAHPSLADPPADKVEIEFPGGYLRMQEDGDQNVWLASPSVKIRRGKLKIACDSLVIWAAKDAGAPGAEDFRLKELYAEGHIRMEEGVQLLEGERAYLNLETGTLLFSKGRLHTASKKRGVPLYLSAEEFRKIGKGDLVGKEVTLSTCEFSVPDYALRVQEVVIHENWQSGDIDLYGILLEVDPFSFPVLYFPYLPVSIGSQLPLRKLRYEKNSRFGHSAYSKWGLDIPRTRRDEHGNPLLDGSGNPDTDTWGTVGWDLDWLEKRGVGGGPEYEYEWEGYRGFGDTYYIRDQGRSGRSDFNERFVPIPREDRGRARLFHRQKIWEGITADLEYHKVSDRNFREEFMEKEFKFDKEPESYALVRWIDGNWAMTALARARANRFQSQVEYLPQVTQALLSTPVWGPFYLTHAAQYANLRFRKDRDFPDADQERMNRFDIHETLLAPLGLGPLRFLGFATARYTYHDYDREEDEWAGRYAFAVGGRARAAMWKKFALKNALLGLDGVRHVASAEVRALAQWTSDSSDRYFQFDAVDQVDRFREVVLEVRNRFQTRNPSTGEVYEVLNFGVAVEFYGDHHRDTTRRLPQNILYPAGWITLAPNGHGDYKARRSSNVHFDLSGQIQEFLRFQTQWDYNPYRGKIEETHGEIRVKPLETLSLRLSQQYVTGLTNTVGIGADWRVSEKWTVGGKIDYDFRADRTLNHSYYIRRDLHDFDVEVGFKFDDGRDETSLSISLIPHGRRQRQLEEP
jgi:lipopolysaccharide assembly outer membrane protein LptD (OstA)